MAARCSGDPAVGRERLLDRETGELVAEGDAVRVRGHDARRQALVQAVQLGRRERLEQPDLGVRRGDRDRLEQLARGRRKSRQTSEDRVAHGVRDLARARREHLGDVERVAVGLAMKLGGVDLVGTGQLADGPLGERRDREPRDPRGGQLAEHQREGVTAVELVVAVAGEDERGDALHLARQEAQHVERRLVGPVEVLEHEDARARPAQLADERTGDLVGSRLAGDQLLELAVSHLGDVEQRAERAWSEQALAGAPQDPRRRAAPIAERAQQGGLAGARLAADEDHRPRARGDHRVERVRQSRQLIGPLEQHPGADYRSAGATSRRRAESAAISSRE